MTKVPRWVLFLLLIFLLLAGILIYLKINPKLNPKPGVEPSPETLPYIEKQTIEEGSEGGMYLLKIEYPKILGLKDTEAQSWANKVLKDYGEAQPTAL